MSAPSDTVRRAGRRATPTTLLALAALAWAGSIVYAQHVGNGSGTMGMAFGAFVAMWATMMAATMLPAITPLISEYAQTINSNRSIRVALIIGAYLLAWTATGIPAYGALRVVDHVVGNSSTVMRNIAGGVIFAAGFYELSPLKSRYLGRCRSPLADLSRDGVKAPTLHELKNGLHYGLACIRCTWGLMVLFIAFGVMNVSVMIALAVVVAAERILPRGPIVAESVGVACLVLAVVVWASPRTADAVVPNPKSMFTMTTTSM